MTDTLSSLSELQHQLETHGFSQDLSVDTAWVVHMGSIPLSVVADDSYLHSKSGYAVCHIRHLSKADGGCSSPRCMVRDSSGIRHSECTRTDCPCQSVCPDADPLCFLELMSQINLSFDNSEHCTLRFEEVAFCSNFTNILSENYSGPMRKFVGFSSFQNAKTIEDLDKVLSTTYWYRKSFHSRKWFRELTVDVEVVRRKMRQVLFTIDSLIIKLLCCFARDTSYKVIAEITDRAFRTLMEEYLAKAVYKDGLAVERPGLFYSDLMQFAKHIKAMIQYEGSSWMLFSGQSEIWDKTIGPVLIKAKDRLDAAACSGRFLDKSIGFICHMVLLSQKRSLGFLPEQLAQVKFDAYRLGLSREPVTWSQEKTCFVFKCFMEELEAEIPHCAGLFTSDEQKLKELAKEVLSGVAAELKPTADVDYPVAQGGKLEKARVLIRLAIDNGWTAPRRSLETGEIVEEVDPIDLQKEGAANFLFWFSLQIVVNQLDDSFNDFKRKFILKSSDTEWSIDSFRGRILHIPESAKMRDLIKTCLTLGFSTSVGGQIMQGILAESKPHKVGLELTSDAWKHSLKCGSDRSGKFLYDAEGKLREEAVNLYLDLTESTDWLSKWLDGIMLVGLHKFTGFPLWYGRFLRMVNSMPLKIEELARQMEDDTVVIHKWTGVLRDGTPMGFQLAKSLLHASHLAAAGCARQKYKKAGVYLNFL